MEINAGVHAVKRRRRLDNKYYDTDRIEEAETPTERHTQVSQQPLKNTWDLERILHMVKIATRQNGCSLWHLNSLTFTRSQRYSRGSHSLYYKAAHNIAHTLSSLLNLADLASENSSLHRTLSRSFAFSIN